jgi:uncharacterized membrane protein
LTVNQAVTLILNTTDLIRMAKAKYSYNYDQDSDKTTITTIEELNGQTITTTKTIEGNQIPQIPQKFFMPTTIGGKVVLGLVALSGLQIFLTIAPQLIITPAALFGAIKFTKNKTKLEKTIAVTVAIVGSFIACSLFTKTPVPSGSFSSSYSSNNITTDSGETITREELRQARIACKQLIEASGSKDTEQCWKYSDQ